MENLYDDICNYEDVNAVEELREENKQLKVKLQEHAAALEKLHKDYDTLETEFKRLEHNYSSLLKTARSEIERKTKMITDLNMEKDKMVIEALKNGRRPRRSFTNPVSGASRERGHHDKYNKERGSDRYVKEDPPPQKSFDRRETHMLPAQDRLPETSTYNRNKGESTSAKAEYNDRKSYVKENVPHHKTENYDPHKISASSIRNRRKSMPATSAPSDIPSSDEDLERNIKTKDSRTDNRNVNKGSLDRHSNKISESSNYQGSSSRDTHKGRTSRYDTPPYRARDNYEVQSRYRKALSPERGQKRLHREYQDDYHRPEQRRHQGRSYESPPEPHSRHQRRLTENRSNYERQYEQDKFRHQYEDKYSTKQRHSSEYDEPLSKKQRTEPVDHSDTHSKDGRRYYPEDQPMSTEPMPSYSPHEYDNLRFSCQSPDSVHTESTNPHTVKEIMAVSEIQLEDPRLSSLKYVVVKENGKDVLSSRVGLNVDLKPIDKSYYGVRPLNVPEALERRPSTDSIISDIYRDVDNPIITLDASIESGEVREADNEYHYIDDRVQQSKYELQPKQVKNISPKQTRNVEKPASQPRLGKYVIPKLSQNSTNTPTNIDAPINYPCETSSHNKHIQKKGVPEDYAPRKSLSCEHTNEGPLTFPNNNCNQKENQSQVTLNKMAMVADDLELSDDTSDNVDIHKHVVQEKVEKSSRFLTNANKDKRKSESPTLSKANVTTKPIDDAETINTLDDAKHREKIESESVKKQKSKKTKSKTKDSVESLEAKCPEKKARSKKEKEIKPKKTKEKFTDLFGDSNSLVTPEDLGIPSYLPISEDAQDAVDMKIDKVINASPPQVDTEEIPLAQTLSAINMKEANTLGDVLRSTASTEHHELPSPIVYENLNPGTDSNDMNVVKTVIISTGVQPEIAFDVNTIRKSADKSMPADVNSKPTALEYKKHDILKALATSTPQKELTAKAPTESNVATIDAANKSDVVKAVLTISNAEPVVKQPVNTLDSHDAPDVRIFMKRRRKVIKRPPMTST